MEKSGDKSNKNNITKVDEKNMKTTKIKKY